MTSTVALRKNRLSDVAPASCIALGGDNVRAPQKPAPTDRPECACAKCSSSDVARQAGRALEANVDRQWLWRRRRVSFQDGSLVSTPDDLENRSECPQPVVQKPGLGFPLARIAAVFALAWAGARTIRSAAAGGTAGAGPGKR